MYEWKRGDAVRSAPSAAARNAAYGPNASIATSCGPTTIPTRTGPLAGGLSGFPRSGAGDPGDIETVEDAASNIEDAPVPAARAATRRSASFLFMVQSVGDRRSRFLYVIGVLAGERGCHAD